MTADIARYEKIRQAFGERVQRDAPLAPYTSARVGGAADIFITVRSARELAVVARRLWAWDMPFWVLGGGSNILVADTGVRGVVILNRSRKVAFSVEEDPPTVWVEAGVNLGSLARRAAQMGLSGLEWAAGIPGTVGGAIVGNAGAHGSEIADVLQVAEILHREKGRGFYPPEALAFGYRTSALKTRTGDAVVLSATFRLRHDDPERIRERMDAFGARRKETQPPGASMGSMFKNPPGDYAGRLIDSAGLKGAAVGDAEISTLHANFFINKGAAKAQEIWALMYLARVTVAQKFGVWLEPEIRLVGEWPPGALAALYDTPETLQTTPVPHAEQGGSVGDTLHLVVLFGGRSGEHEVSLMSARSVLDALDTARYEIIPVGITKTGRWLTGPDVLEAFIEGRTDADDLVPVTLLPDPSRRGLWRLDDEHGAQPYAPIDVVFPLIHGTFGEDGTLQGVLELADVAYVGAGVAGSAVGMDKGLFKDIMRAHGIDQTAYRVFSRREVENNIDDVAARCEEIAPYPLFVKPANLGSSVGITKAHNREELLEGLRVAARYDRRLVVEQGLDAREIEVSVLGNETPQASLPGEIVPAGEFYSYEAKYEDAASQLHIPAPLSAEETETVQALALKVYRAVDGAGMARVDFLLDKQSKKFYINEVNTLPGFTQISMYPKLWEASGLPYAELLDKLVALALERKAARDRTQRER